MKTWRVAGINFDHMHMGDNLRMVHEHPHAEIVALCDVDRGRMRDAAENFSIPDENIFTDCDECLESCRPDFVILCPATAEHGAWTEKVARHGVHILMEKPFAAGLEEADAMCAAVESQGLRLAINWPLAWYPSHRTAKRIIDEGLVGDVVEVHYYDGNRGPLWHVSDKRETTVDFVNSGKPGSWFYKKASGGGSLLDYLGYGTTLATWYQGGRAPLEVTCVVDEPAGLEVDEHSITIARYAHGLSKFETRWGAFSDPWTHQPQPKCGFVITGTEGTVSSYDFEESIRIQTRDKPEGMEIPVDALEAPHADPVSYFIHCLEDEREIEGPLSPAISRIGQQIVDTAARSAELKKTLPLID